MASDVARLRHTPFGRVGPWSAVWVGGSSYVALAAEVGVGLSSRRLSRACRHPLAFAAFAILGIGRREDASSRGSLFQAVPSAAGMIIAETAPSRLCHI